MVIGRKISVILLALILVAKLSIDNRINCSTNHLKKILEAEIPDESKLLARSLSELLVRETQPFGRNSSSISNLKSNIKTAKISKTNSTILAIQVTAIHIDRAEFPLTKLLFKLTLKLALSAAEKKLESRRVKLLLNFRSGNTCSSQFAGAIAAEEYYLKRSRLFIVSGCDDAIRAVSRLASGWNVPIMTAAGFGADLNDKSVHKTLVRVAFSLKTAVEFLIKILKSYSWHRVNLIVDESDANSLALRDSIGMHLHQSKASNFQINLNKISLDMQFLFEAATVDELGQNSTHSSSSSASSEQKRFNGKISPEDKWPNEITDRAVRDSLRQSSLFSRVNILLMPQHHLRRFMLTAYDLNMANGLYTFINMPLLLITSSEDQVDNSQASLSTNYSKQSYSSSTGENVFIWRSLASNRNSQAKQAFESLMSIYLRTPATKAYIYFASKLLNLANLDFATTTTTQATSIGDNRINSSTKNASDIPASKIQLSINPYSASFYDLVQIYSTALSESLATWEGSVNFIGNNVSDVNFAKQASSLHGNLSNLVRNRRFDNMVTGSIFINENGDRETDYTLNDMNPMTGKFNPVIIFKGESRDIERIGRIHWSSDDTVGPTLDNVDCALNDTCAGKPWSKFFVTFMFILTPVGVLMSMILYFVYTRINLESQLVDYWWKISFKEVEIIETRRKVAGDNSSLVSGGRQTTSLMSRFNKKTGDEDNTNLSDKVMDEVIKGVGEQQHQQKNPDETSRSGVTRATETTSGFGASATDYCYGDISLGLYKLNKVALKPIAEFHQSRKLMIELRTIKTIRHSNLCIFVGIIVDEPNMALVNEFCPKGSLREFFQNESMVIDWTFKYSIINDVLAGLNYLHSSQLEFHGRLKASNCLVSSRFVVKLSDYGLRSLYDQLDDSEPNELNIIAKKISLAPEFMKFGTGSGLAKNFGSQMGDMYSFGLLLYEIITNNIPFRNEEKSDFVLPIKQLYSELKSNGISERTGPNLAHVDLAQNSHLSELVELMKRCWSFDPIKRPSLQDTNVILKRITKGVTSKKLLENLTSRMEQYTNNLESLVEEKLASLIEEKLKTEELLYQFVPKSIASLIKEGQTIEPEAFDCVTVFYSDIVGFTSLSSESSPMEVIDFLSDLYLCFDETLKNFDIFKVDTIGDAYIVASGLPERNEGKHVIEIASAALELRARIASFQIPHKPGRSLQMRVGINSGPCVAGIVGGTNMPKYCVFGDTLSIGKFMESSGLPMKIHITEESKILLDKVDKFKIEPRTPKICKDGLPMQTYWLEDDSADTITSKQ